ncbi:MAG: ribosome assembly factor SBDS [Methanosphaera sp.]|uniref:ribosome assembly factor SBDS n=1 Tax=Methanosphaera sp. BMS TaxID=1789762 RepID=UPI000DC1E00E|nr:ribosome assembly factor SBDS [Methanosphaera sp. BMS]AWX33298.1 RNA-associated protein [Methanosphaera sp. BMS]MBQ6443696.1 ribosome assembly factor SBDS [Methanosphaera sp.]MBR3213342.1 ribosome assembly factor SBDS [Methanosphaera sp.]
MVNVDDAVIARLESYGERFEILVDAELAADYKRGQDIAIEDVLAVEEVFKDAHKADKASEEAMEKAFETTDALEVADKIIKKGNIQITANQKRKMQEEKTKQVIAQIAREAINPQTKLPHPPQRIQKAMEEAKVHIDPMKSVEEQIEPTVKAILTKIPIRIEKVKIAAKIPGTYAGKAYSTITQYGKLEKEEWMNDGSWIGVIEIPGGLQDEFYTALSGLTHGEVETKLID